MYDQKRALVLNADFQPLSYFPLSTINWHDAVKGVYERTHAVVAEYDTVVHSPSITMKLPSVLALRQYQPQPKHVPSRGSTSSCAIASAASIAVVSTRHPT